MNLKDLIKISHLKNPLGSMAYVKIFQHFYWFNVLISIIVGFTLTVVNDFCGFLSQFSTNFHEILHTLFSIQVVTTLKVSQSFDKYFRS